jgi:hypothetical protein
MHGEPQSVTGASCRLFMRSRGRGRGRYGAHSSWRVCPMGLTLPRPLVHVYAGSQPPPTGLAPYAQQQQQQQQQQQLHYAPAQVPPTAALQPPPVHVVQQHQHIVVVDEPLIVRSRAAAPRFVTCPSCFSSGPTVVKRESGCCTYLVRARECVCVCVCVCVCWVEGLSVWCLCQLHRHPLTACPARACLSPPLLPRLGGVPPPAGGVCAMLGVLPALLAALLPRLRQGRRAHVRELQNRGGARGVDGQPSAGPCALMMTSASRMWFLAGGMAAGPLLPRVWCLGVSVVHACCKAGQLQPPACC